MPRVLHIRVFIQSQTMELWQDETLLKTYPVSTSKFGTGTEEGSFKTPLGHFLVCEKFGDRVPRLTTFQSRQPVGEWNPDEPGEADLVVARILRLDGQDEENGNSYQRFIYVHGTNQEDLIGTPASQGCVRMKIDDVIGLYELVPLNTAVQITPG